MPEGSVVPDGLTVDHGQPGVLLFADIHIKELFLCRHRLAVAPTQKALRSILDKIRRIGEAEIKNAARRSSACRYFIFADG